MNNINNDVNNDLNKTIEALNHFVNIDDCDIEYLKDEAESAREEYEQGYTNGLKDAYNNLEICMSNMRRKMIMEKEKKDSQVQDKECDR